MLALSRTASLAAPIYYGGLRALRVPSISRRLRDAGLILCYHNVVGAGAPAAGDPAVHVPVDRFIQQMEWFASRYTTIPLGEFVERLEAGARMRALAATTFDDGYNGVFEHAVPVLRALGLPATVFLVSGAPGGADGFWWDRPEVVECPVPSCRRVCLDELGGDAAAIAARHRSPRHGACPPTHRAADWETIRRGIGHGIDIGAHSATHRSLPTLSDADLDAEISESRARICAATGIKPMFFAYPYGNWDARVRARVRAAGYRGALTLDGGLNRPRSDPWSLRRINVPAAISAAALEAWAAGLQARRP